MRFGYGFFEVGIYCKKCEMIIFGNEVVHGLQNITLTNTFRKHI
jgi:hypothetical protein